jgi:general stress protein 26
MMSDDLKRKIIGLLSGQNDMTIATIRPDGYPQATTVSYVSEGTDIYFGCGAESQKARNIALDNRVSCTINAPYEDWRHIAGLSLGGRAFRVESEAEIARVGAMMFAKFPQALSFESDVGGSMALFRIKPEVVSVLDYTKGFGHTDLVTM